jgi:putative phosphoesterase
MRVAALYDIHGNVPALQAVLADVEREDVDAIVVGGDMVSGASPAEALDVLEALGERVLFLRGNADRMVLERAEDSGAWCRDRLGDERAARVATWPLTLSLDVDGVGAVRFCHATPRSDEEIVTRITPEAEVAETLEGTDEAIVVCGHTHIQYDRRIGSRRLVCAGSVGWPYEGRRGAFWLLLGPDIAHRRTDYEVELAVEDVRSSGHPKSEDVAGFLLEPPDPDEVSAFFEGMRGS